MSHKPSFAALMDELERFDILKVTLTRERTGHIGADGYRRLPNGYGWHHVVGGSASSPEGALADLLKQLRAAR